MILSILKSLRTSNYYSKLNETFHTPTRIFFYDFKHFKVLKSKTAIQVIASRSIIFLVYFFHSFYILKYIKITYFINMKIH